MSETTSSTPNSEQPRVRRRKPWMGSLVLAVTSVAIASGIFAAWRINTQMALVRRIEDLGGVVHTKRIWTEFISSMAGEQWSKGVERIWGVDFKHVTDDRLLALRQIDTLIYVGLDFSDANNEHLKILRGMTELESLKLQATGVTDEGLRQVATLTKLEVIDLTGTNVTDAGLKHLHGLTNLRTIYAGSTGITEDGITDIRKAIPRCAVHQW